MRIFGGLAACIAGALLAASCGPEAAVESQDGPPPNVILYLSDALRADAIEPYGNGVVSTPALARLAREGVRYENVYAQSSWTRSSVASILTGTHPDLHGVELRRGQLDPSWLVLPEILAEQGYQTAYITANPNVGAFYGFDQGFASLIQLYGRRKPGVVGADELVASSREVTDRAIAWVEQAGSPFFLFVLAVDPHWPYDPPAEFDDYAGDYGGAITPGSRFDRDTRPDDDDLSRIRSLYYGEISYNDDSLGRLLDHLETRDDYDDTVFVFSSDHGEEFWEHGLSGHGRNLYEEVLRVPLIIRHPRRFAAGRVVAEPVELVDLFPTILALADIEPPTDRDGRLLAEAAAQPARTIHAKLALDRNHAEVLLRFPWKLHIRRAKVGKREVQLYDLASDPGETRDRSAEQPSRVAAMLAELEDRYRRRERYRSGVDPGGSATRRELPEDVAESLRAMGYLE